MSDEFIHTLEKSYVISKSQLDKYTIVNNMLQSMLCNIGGIECIIKKVHNIKYTIQNKKTKEYLIYYNNELSFVPFQKSTLFQNNSNYIIIADEICLTIVPYSQDIKLIHRVLCIDNNQFRCIQITSNSIIKPNVLTIFKYVIFKEPTPKKSIENKKKEVVKDANVNILHYTIPNNILHIIITDIEVLKHISHKYKSNIIDYSDHYNIYRSNTLSYLKYIIDYYDKLPVQILFLGNQITQIFYEKKKTIIPVESFIHIKHNTIYTILNNCIRIDEKKKGYRYISNVYSNSQVPLDTFKKNQYDYWIIENQTHNINQKLNMQFFWCSFIKKDIPSDHYIKCSNQDQYSLFSIHITKNNSTYYKSIYNNIVHDNEPNTKLNYLQKTFFYLF